MKASRHEDAPGDRSAESDARCIEVGFRMFIFVVRCVAMRELRPSPVNVEESLSGALLGLLGACGTDPVDFSSNFGLEENSEDILFDLSLKAVSTACHTTGTQHTSQSTDHLS